MNAYYEATILDVVFAVLEGADRPLSPYEIEDVALVAGYDLSAWEAAEEIEAHLEIYGPQSPFIQVGRQKYWLQFEPLLENKQPAPALIFLLILLVMAMVVTTVTGWLAFSSPAAPQQLVVSAPAPAAAVPDRVPVPAPPAAGPQSIAINPAWWSQNAVNQINLDTQAVSREYLSNFYNTCGPAAVSMVVTFYRSQPGGTSDRVTTADVLRDARANLGFFIPPYNSGLLDFKKMSLLAEMYGLALANPSGRGYLMTLDELLEGVRQGTPAIVGMRYGYRNGLYVPVGGSGIYDHFVIIFGTEVVDGQEHLLVLNNHPGKNLIHDEDVRPEQMSLDIFQQSWLLRDGSQYQNYGEAAFYKPAP
jgi:hypothetical protein